jgi:hypothetical protein
MSQEDADKIRRAYEVWNASGPEAVRGPLRAVDGLPRLPPEPYPRALQPDR